MRKGATKTTFDRQAENMSFLSKKYKYWTEEDWAKVIWTDESKVEVMLN